MLPLDPLVKRPSNGSVSYALRDGSDNRLETILFRSFGRRMHRIELNRASRKCCL